MIAVIPCSARKLDRPARARELYTGPLFRSAYLAATALELEAVVILSGRYGLVGLEEWLDPYEQRIDGPGAIATHELARQLDALEAVSVLPLLPRAYANALELAAAMVNNRRRLGWANGYPLAEPGGLELVELEPNPLDGSAGILEQRARLRRIREAAAA